MAENKNIPPFDNFRDFVYKMASTYAGKDGYELEDLEQEAYIAYETAKATYDPEKAKFFTWYVYQLRGHLKNIFNKTKYDGMNYAGLESLDAPVDEDCDCTLYDITPSNQDNEDDDEIDHETISEITRQLLEAAGFDVDAFDVSDRSACQKARRVVLKTATPEQLSKLAEFVQVLRH